MGGGGVGVSVTPSLIWGRSQGQGKIGDASGRTRPANDEKMAGRHVNQKSIVVIPEKFVWNWQGNDEWN